MGYIHHLLSNFFSAKNRFYAIWITFNTFLALFEGTKLLRLGSQLKELNYPALSPSILVKSRTRFNASIFGLNFLKDFTNAKGG